MKYSRIWWSWDECSPIKRSRPELSEIKAAIALRDELMQSEGSSKLWRGRFPQYLMEFLRDWSVLPNRGLNVIPCMSLEDIKAEYDFWTYGR